MSQIRNAVIEVIAHRMTQAEFLADTLQECGHEISTADILDALAIGGYQLMPDTTNIPMLAYRLYLDLNSGGETE